jgi:hypothetical protein
MENLETVFQDKMQHIVHVIETTHKAMNLILIFSLVIGFIKYELENNSVKV